MIVDNGQAMNSLSSRNYPIWESSKRPLYPKCVWVDVNSSERRRHYIFDHEIHTARATNTEPPTTPSKWARTVSFDGNRNNLSSPILVGCLSASANAINWSTRKTSSDDATNSNLSKEVDAGKALTANKNDLADRVLQWLDLAGQRKGNEYERRKKILNIKSKNIAEDLAERKQVSAEPKASISRRESIHCLSLKFSDEHFVQNDDRKTINFGEFFPITYRSAKKFLSLRSSAKPSSMESSSAVNAETLEHAKNDSRKKSAKLRNKQQNNDLMENQYRSLIQRQILQSSCNQQIAKRQLHIFMPNLPKRNGSAASQARSNLECDSVASTEMSQFSTSK